MGRTPYEDFYALRDVSFEVAEGRRPACSATTARASRRCSSASPAPCGPTIGHDPHPRARGRAARARRRLPRRPDRPREHVPQRFDPRASRRPTSSASSTTSSSSPRSRQFIDMQVKHYSSGMTARLGFALAIHVDPDIVLVDEVLAVGDESFQRKCLERVREFQAEGRTILRRHPRSRPVAPGVPGGRGARPGRADRRSTSRALRSGRSATRWCAAGSCWRRSSTRSTRRRWTPAC